GDGRWAMGDGRWAMGDGRWAMGDGRSQLLINPPHVKLLLLLFVLPLANSRSCYSQKYKRARRPFLYLAICD
ncbi:hypothetical protein ACQKPX_23175, partial [Photobacterium sp. DNB23_23_1]